MKNKKRFKGIQFRIVLYFVTLFFIISLITGGVQYQINTGIQIQAAREEVRELAAAAALLIDGDIHETLVSKEDETSDGYKEIRSKLQEFVKDTGVSGVFTVAKSGDDKTHIIANGYENAAGIGHEYDYLPEMETAFQGNSSSIEEIFEDEWGAKFSGFAPIKNSREETIAIVVLDMDASDLIQQKTSRL